MLNPRVLCIHERAYALWESHDVIDLMTKPSDIKIYMGIMGYIQLNLCEKD